MAHTAFGASDESSHACQQAGKIIKINKPHSQQILPSSCLLHLPCEEAYAMHSSEPICKPNNTSAFAMTREKKKAPRQSEDKVPLLSPGLSEIP